MSLGESKFDEGSAEQGNRIVKATKRCSHSRAWRIPIRNEDSATKETKTMKVADSQNGKVLVSISIVSQLFFELLLS